MVIGEELTEFAAELQVLTERIAITAASQRHAAAGGRNPRGGAGNA